MNELQRMLRHGWCFCEDCRRKIEIENLVDFCCPECADRKRIKSRAVAQPKQEHLIPIANQYQYALPEGCAAEQEI